MGIFSGEKYSKEAYEKAEKLADSAEKSARFRGTSGMEKMGPDARQAIYDELWKDAEKAKRRVEKLYSKGQAEGIALNEEYDRLRTQAQEAIKALADFEREKLGMREDEPKSGEETKEAGL